MSIVPHHIYLPFNIDRYRLKTSDGKVRILELLVEVVVVDQAVVLKTLCPVEVLLLVEEVEE